MLKFWSFFEKIFFILKLKNIKILDEFEKNFFLNFQIKNIKILDEFEKFFFEFSIKKH